MFILKIRTNGDAFLNPNTNTRDLDPRGTEVRRLLKQVSNQLDMGFDAGTIFDISGEYCGDWRYEFGDDVSLR